MKYIVSVAQEGKDGTVGALQHAYDTEAEARSAVYSEMASAYAAGTLASDTVVLFATNGYVIDTLHMQGAPKG